MRRPSNCFCWTEAAVLTWAMPQETPKNKLNCGQRRRPRSIEGGGGSSQQSQMKFACKILQRSFLNWPSPNSGTRLSFTLECHSILHLGRNSLEFHVTSTVVPNRPNYTMALISNWRWKRYREGPRYWNCYHNNHQGRRNDGYETAIKPVLAWTTE